MSTWASKRGNQPAKLSHDTKSSISMIGAWSAAEGSWARWLYPESLGPSMPTMRMPLIGLPPYGAGMDPLDLPAIVEVCRSLKRGWDLGGISLEAWGAAPDELLTPVDPLASVTLRLGETSGVAEIWPTGYVRLERGGSCVDHVQVGGPAELRDQLVRLTNWVRDHDQAAG